MKGQRHIKIREIISQHEIETQDDLVEALREAGFSGHPGHCIPGYQRTAAHKGSNGRRQI